MKFPRVATIENALILAGIALFWPYIVGYRGTLYIAMAIGMAAVLAIIAVIRLVRFKRAMEAHSQNAHHSGAFREDRKP